MRYYYTCHETCRGLVAADDIPEGANVQELTQEEYEGAIARLSEGVYE